MGWYVWLIHGGIPITANVESLRFATGGEIHAKRCLELRPSRKRRREVVEPDEEFEYPFGDDLVGSPVARAGPGEAQQLPFFDASDPDLEEYYPSPATEAAGEPAEPPPVLPPPGLLPQGAAPALPPVTEEAMDTSIADALPQEPEAEQVPPSAPPSAPMSRLTSDTQPMTTTPPGGNDSRLTSNTQPTTTTPPGGGSE